MKFTCDNCTRTDEFTSFGDANSKALWNRVHGALLCGACYLKHITENDQVHRAAASELRIQ
jgi:hypothetical protein